MLPGPLLLHGTDVEILCSRAVSAYCRKSESPLSEDDKEDLLAELLEVACGLSGKFDPDRGTRFDQYAYPILLLRCVDWLRKSAAARDGNSPGTSTTASGPAFSASTRRSSAFETIPADRLSPTSLAALRQITVPMTIVGYSLTACCTRIGIPQSFGRTLLAGLKAELEALATEPEPSRRTDLV